MTYYYNAHDIGIDTKDPAFDSFIGEVPGDKSLPAVYLFSQARNGDGTAVAMCEDGTVIATHWCSHWGYMLHDLHDIRRDRYQKHYPDGYRLVVLGPSEIPPPDVVARNRALGAAAKTASGAA